MNLSKAFDTIDYELLIAKLHAYGFGKSALKFLLHYLSNRWQCTKINKKFCSWIELMQGVSQRSVLGPLLFNIYLYDHFFWLNPLKFAIFLTTLLFSCEKELNFLVNRLEHDSLLAIEWCENNYMKLNQEKFNFLVSEDKFEGRNWPCKNLGKS